MLKRSLLADKELPSLAQQQKDKTPVMTAAENDHEPPPSLPDFEMLSRNMALFVEQAGKATAAYLKPIEERRAKTGLADEIADMVRTLGQVAECWLIDPQKAVEAHSRITTTFLDLWANTLHRMQGKETTPVAEPEPRDHRFQDSEWKENPLFDFIKQAYLITARWADDMVDGAQGLDDHTRHKAHFFVKQLSSALSPSNFIATNPELIRETIKESGANLVRGMKMLAEDIEAGHGELKIRQSDPHKFEVGVNMAVTPGKVVFRNDLMELIQYTPSTEQVLKKPILLIPPWINKYYVLDLNPEKSFIRWAVAQGLTVFCISWVNPDERHADKGFDAYMKEGIFAGINAIKQTTGEDGIHAIGYCVGGTLLSIAMAYLEAKGEKSSIHTATLLTTQVDFTHAGDLKVFIDEAQIRAIEAMMAARGYLEGSRMANAFNMLRPNDLIWPYVVNVYLKGHSPFPFDLLHWNADSTRMPAANHSFYLRECYLENKLMRGLMEIDNVRIDLSRVKVPVFSLATKEDHIAPARSVFIGSQAFGGPVEFVLSGSGHIAGVVNPPARGKYPFWTNGVAMGELEDWLSNATEHKGSWWPYWFAWLEKQSPERVKARQPGTGALKALCDAPGDYVKAKS